MTCWVKLNSLSDDNFFFFFVWWDFKGGSKRHDELFPFYGGRVSFHLCMCVIMLLCFSPTSLSLRSHLTSPKSCCYLSVYYYDHIPFLPFHPPAALASDFQRPKKGFGGIAPFFVSSGPLSTLTFLYPSGPPIGPSVDDA